MKHDDFVEKWRASIRVMLIGIAPSEASRQRREGAEHEFATDAATARLAVLDEVKVKLCSYCADPVEYHHEVYRNGKGWMHPYAIDGKHGWEPGECGASVVRDMMAKT